MNCEQMQQLMSLWLDGEISAQEQEQLQTHLERCPECRALLEQLQTLHTSFSDLEEIPAPEGFAQGVMDRIAAGESKPRAKVIPLFKRPQMRAVAGLAACAVLCIGFARFAPGMSKSGAAEPMAAPMAPPMPAPEAAVASAPEQHYDFSIPDDESVIRQAVPEIIMDAVPGASAGVETEALPIPPAEWVQPEVPVAAPECREEESANVIVLEKLPEGAQDELGELNWQRRNGDGVLCAEVTRQQAQRLLELSAAQGLPVEQQLPQQGENPRWIVVLNG